MSGRTDFAALEAFFPVKGVPDNRREIIMNRLPAKFLTNAVGPGNQGRRITGTAFGQIDGEINARDLFDGVNDLADRETAPIPAIHHIAFAALFKLSLIHISEPTRRS